MADDDKETGAAVYVAWATFNNAVAQLAHGVPNRIDRSVFPGQSWAVQGQLLAALRFLGLIDEDGKPLPALVAVAVPDEEARKTVLRRIIADKYSQLFALDLVKTTPSELAEKMGAAYSVTGDTREKAIRFFLAATSYLGIPLSPLLNRDKARPANGPGARRRRVTRPRPTEQEPPPQAPTPQATTTGGTSRSIQLRSGGTLTISATLDLFSLIAADRSFVFELIDKLDSYEKQTGA